MTGREMFGLATSLVALVLVAIAAYRVGRLDGVEAARRVTRGLRR